MKFYVKHNSEIARELYTELCSKFNLNESTNLFVHEKEGLTLDQGLVFELRDNYEEMLKYIADRVTGNL